MRNSPEYAALVLRASLGVMYLTHSLVLKVGTFGVGGTMKFFESIGLPGPVAVLVIVAEALGGTLLVLGIKARAVALALVPILLGAAWVHAGNGWVFTAPGGGWEYPAFLVAASVAVALLGDGPQLAASRLIRNAPVEGASAAASNRARSPSPGVQRRNPSEA